MGIMHQLWSSDILHVPIMLETLGLGSHSPHHIYHLGLYSYNSVMEELKRVG